MIVRAESQSYAAGDPTLQFGSNGGPGQGEVDVDTGQPCAERHVTEQQQAIYQAVQDTQQATGHENSWSMIEAASLSNPIIFW